MALLKSQATISASRRGIGSPARIICACCASHLDPDDFGSLCCADHEQAVLALYDGPVCTACDAEHSICVQCGDIGVSGAMHKGRDGGLVHGECFDAHEADYRAAQADHKSLLAFGRSITR